MEANDRQGHPERQIAGDGSLDQEDLQQAGGREGTAPPGSSEIDSTAGSGLADNPALRVRRDAGDILADQVREGDRENS